MIVVLLAAIGKLTLDRLKGLDTRIADLNQKVDVIWRRVVRMAEESKDRRRRDRRHLDD